MRNTETKYTGRVDASIQGTGKTIFGAAVIRAGASRSVTAAGLPNEDDIIGFAIEPANGVVLDDDFFYKQYDPMRIARDGEVTALIITKGATDIVDGDFLEVADLGDSTPGAHGLLEEAGATDGTINVTTAVAKAREDITLGAASMAQPASNVAIGDLTATMAAAFNTALLLEEGSIIYLRDINGKGQVNRVKELTDTVITFEFASTVALAANTDYIHLVKQCRVKILNN